ncbi:MAG: hypothetical protein R3B40_23790 [Polyangiales bacterium]|nr:hypothetical protein [Sandaracinaceae bacterium]
MWCRGRAWSDGDPRYARSALALLAGVALAFGSTGTAHAQHAAAGASGSAPDNIVVEAFRGITATSTRAHLVTGLDGHPLFHLLDADAVQARGRELFDTTRFSPEQYAQLASDLDVRAFLSGRVARRSGRYLLTVEVRSGQTGAVVGEATWRVARPSGFSVLENEAYAQLSELLDQTMSPVRAAPGDDETPPDVPPVEAPPEVPPPHDPDVVADADDPRLAYDLRRMDAFRVEVLVGTLRRNLDATAEVDPALRGGSPGDAPVIEPRGFHSRGLGSLELGLRLEFFPGALLPDQERLGFFGFYMAYRHSAGLSLTFDGCPVGSDPRCTDEDGVVKLAAHTSDLDMGIRLRHRFGRWRHSPTLMADIGYGIFSFVFDADGLMRVRADQILPPMRYRQLHLGTGLEVGIVPVYLSFVGRFHYRLGTQIGSDAEAIWGGETYDIRGVRILAELRTEMPYVLPGLYLGLGAEFFRYATVFRGQTACASPDASGGCAPDALWEPWPTLVDTTSGTRRVSGGLRDAVHDSYFRITLTLGYAFR